MNYLILQNSGKQFFFEKEKWYDIDYIKNVEIGNLISLNKILLFKKDKKVQLGFPFLPNGKIIGKVIQQVKGKKIIVLKTKPKKKYTRTYGHRQNYTRIELKNIN